MYRQQDMDKLGASEATAKSPEDSSKKSNSKIYFFIIAIEALLATNVYFYVKVKSSGVKLNTIAIQKQDLQVEIGRIEAELDHLVAQKEVGVDAAMRGSEMRSRQVISGLLMRLENQSVSQEDMLVA